MIGIKYLDFKSWLTTDVSPALFICSAGFEDRSLAFCQHPELIKRTARIMLLHFVAAPPENERNYQRAMECLEGKPISHLEFFVDEPNRAINDIEKAIADLQIDLTGPIVVDVSGMPQIAICLFLYYVRAKWPLSQCICLYASAQSYPPNDAVIQERLSAFNASSDSIALTEGDSSAYDIVFPKQFCGDQDKLDKTCLFLFPGMSLQRSVSAYESINPARLVCCFDHPAPEYSPLRLKYSETIHQSLGQFIERADRIVQNEDINGLLAMLESFYEPV